MLLWHLYICFVRVVYRPLVLYGSSSSRVLSFVPRVQRRKIATRIIYHGTTCLILLCRVLSCCVPRPAAIGICLLFFFSRFWYLFSYLPRARCLPSPARSTHLGVSVIVLARGKNVDSHDFVLYCRSLVVRAHQVKPVRPKPFRRF